MKIKDNHKCLDCGKSAKEVRFPTIKPKNKEYVVMHCNKCISNRAIEKRLICKKEQKEKRRVLIRNKIDHYFKITQNKSSTKNETQDIQ